ncbi:MAG TPA: hypothetical protein VF031_10985, partial [Alphaproteobacteria bacterium]
MRTRLASRALRCGALLLAATLIACQTPAAPDPSAAAARQLIAEAQSFLPEAGPEFGQRPILLARLAQAHAETGERQEAERLFAAA